MSFGKITKAVFPVAGLGSRFLPATKASPKEMLPVVDKPLIQYAVEEAAAAGITDMVFITGRNKRAIEDHFDKAYELETELTAAQQDASCSRRCSRSLAAAASTASTSASRRRWGSATPCCAPQPVVNNEPFAVLLADDLIDAEVPVMKQMTDLAESRAMLGHRRHGRDRRRQVDSYGIVEDDGSNDRRTQPRSSGIVEKPKPGTTPSTPWRGRPLRAHAAIFASSARHAAGRRRRDPAHRRHRPPACRRRGCWRIGSKAAATIAAASSAISRRRSTSA